MGTLARAEDLRVGDHVKHAYDRASQYPNPTGEVARVTAIYTIEDNNGTEFFRVEVEYMDGYTTHYTSYNDCTIDLSLVNMKANMEWTPTNA